MYVLNDPNNYEEWKIISEVRLKQARMLIDAQSNTLAIYLLCHAIESSLKGLLKARERNGRLAKLGHDLDAIRVMADSEVPKGIFTSEAAKVLEIVDTDGRSNYTMLRYQHSEDCIPDIDVERLIGEVSRICTIINRRSESYSDRRRRRR